MAQPATDEEADDSHLEALLKTAIVGELVKRFATKRDFDTIESDQKALVLLDISMNSEASQELRCYSLDRLSSLVSDATHTWSTDNLVSFCDDLLKSLLIESDDSIREKMGELLATVTRHALALGSQASRSIANFVQRCAENECASLKIIALSAVKPKLFGVERLDDLNSVLQTTLADNDATVRFASMKTFFAVASKETMSTLSQLVPSILRVAKNDAAARAYLVDETSRDGAVLHAHISEVVSIYCQLLADVNVDCRTRELAIWWITGLAKIPEMSGQIEPFIPRLLSSGLLAMSQQNDEDWTNRDEFLEGTSALSEGNIYADDTRITKFDQLVAGYEGLGVFQNLLQITESLRKDEDWKQRYAGVFGLSALSCCITTTETATDLLTRIVSFLRDKHDRVRSAACAALVRFFEACAPNLLEKSHAIVIPALLPALEDARVPRVSAAAAAALIACCKRYSKPAICTYLSAVMYAAVRVIKATYRSLLADGRTWILAQPISLICFLKDVNNSYFFVYHEELIGPLKTIIMARNHGPMLDSVALECAALVAAAVDDQKCASDCSEMMHAIMGRFDEHLGDTKEKYLFPSRQGMFSTSLAALAVAMGPAFLPFLPAVMNSSIGAIRTPVFENEDGRRYVENFVAIDRKKGVACDVILKLVHQLRGLMAPHASELVALALESLTKEIYRDNAEFAASIIPPLLDIYKSVYDEAGASKLWAEYFAALKERKKKREYFGHEFLESIYKSLLIIGKLTEEEKILIKQIMQGTKEVLHEDREEDFDCPCDLGARQSAHDKKTEDSIKTLEQALTKFK